MKTIDVADANAPLTVYAKNARRDPIIVTKSGKPLAAVISLKDLDWESVRLCMNRRFIKIIEKSRRRRRKEGGIPSREVRRQLGLER